jgi:hypothetical protein
MKYALHFIGQAFHPDGIRASKTFHWAGRAGTEIGQKRDFANVSNYRHTADILKRLTFRR